MSPGEKYCFLCVNKMAEGMNRVVSLAGGEIIARDNRSYGVVLTVRKN